MTDNKRSDENRIYYRRFATYLAWTGKWAACLKCRNRCNEKEKGKNLILHDADDDVDEMNTVRLIIYY